MASSTCKPARAWMANMLSYAPNMPIAIIHVTMGRTRTTISLDRVLADLLSIHLCGRIENSAVAKWCQQQIDKDPGAFAARASQRLGSQAALEIAPKQIRDAYWDQQLQSPRDKKLSNRRRQKPRPPRRRAAASN